MTATQTITGIVLNSGAAGTFDANGGDFDMLRDSVIAAGLAEVLDDSAAELTVFAPNDAAFVALAQTLGYGGSDEAGSLGFILEALTLLGGGDPIPLLTEILTYHVVDGVFDLDAVLGLGNGANIGTLQGGDVTLNLTSTPPSLMDEDNGLDDPGLIAFDVLATNGVIHVLDGVLQPLSVTDILSQPNTDFIIGSAQGESFKTGKGNDFISGGAGHDNINAGRDDDVALGGDGNDRVSGKKGSDVLKGDAGNDDLKGNAGNDMLDGGTGSDTLNGGHGNDVFVFSEGYGADTIRRFENGVDKIDVSGFGIHSFGEMQGMIHARGNRTEIDLGDGDVLTLSRFDRSDLDQSDFIFA